MLMLPLYLHVNQISDYDDMMSVCLVLLLCSLNFNSHYLKLLLSQTENSGPLEFDITRVHCILGQIW